MANLSNAATPLANNDITANMEVRDANGAPILKDDGVSPVTIELYGADSDIARKVKNATTNRYLDQGRQAKVTAESSDADQITYLARLTKSWDGVGIDEDVSECTFENARKLYTMFPDIRDQAQKFVDARVNFLKASQQP